MIRVLAPRWPRGYSWVCLSIGLSALFPLVGLSQSPGKASDASKKGAPAAPAAKGATSTPVPSEAAGAKEKADDSKDKDAAPASDTVKDPAVEIFKDPKTLDLLEKKYKGLSGEMVTQPLKKQVLEMAVGAPINRDVVARLVAGYAADLTNPNYLKGFLEIGQAGGVNSQRLRQAVSGLLEPLDQARRSTNSEFLNAYSQELLKVLPRVLENHPVSRLFAVIVLGQTGSPDTIDTFVKQLNDKNQTVWVKLWSARGITNIAQTPAGNRVDEMLAGRAIPAAKALSGFLNRETDSPWPAQLRGLEALGALRLAADPAAPAKVEMADAAARLLASPTAKLEVRAQAAWALGMMRLGSGVAQFNYPLVAYFIGGIAADVGERVATSHDDNVTRGEYWTSILVYQIFPAFFGQEGAKESGLLKIPGVQSNKAVADVANLVKPVVKTAVDLIKAPRGIQPQLSKELQERVGQLRAFLEHNPPSNTFLVPQGNQFPLKAEVAGEPAQPARVAGAAGAR